VRYAVGAPLDRRVRRHVLPPKASAVRKRISGLDGIKNAIEHKNGINIQFEGPGGRDQAYSQTGHDQKRAIATYIKEVDPEGHPARTKPIGSEACPTPAIPRPKFLVLKNGIVEDFILRILALSEALFRTDSRRLDAWFGAYLTRSTPSLVSCDA
jgi:hypothetical protein